MNASASPSRTGWIPFRWILPLLLLALVPVTSGCVSTGVNPVSGNTRAYGYTWEEEVELGQQADQQIRQQFGVYDDDALQQYLDRVAQEVLTVSHMRRTSTNPQFRDTEFTFRILDSPVINAFALPGGFVYVTRGLMAHLNNEAQLAVVLGHEIGHVAARHASQQAARQQFTQGLLLAGAVAGQATLGGEAAQNILGLGGQAAQLLSLSYSRDNERESDRLGVEYATMAGYEAAEGSEFFTTLKRIQQQSGQSIPTWQSTHPDPGRREDTIVELAGEWEQKVEGPSDVVEQDAYFAELEDLVLGENPRQGFVENDVFYHPDLRFRFPVPSGWRVVNQPSQVALVAPNQDGYLIFGFAQEETPEAAASAFASQQGVTVLDRSTTTVNGIPAQRVLVGGQTQQGQEIRLLGYFLAYDGNVYRYQGVTTGSLYNTYRPRFERTVQGFRELTDPAKLNVQPTRLRVEAANRTDAFRTFVDDAALPESMTIDDLAIINQLQLDTTVEAGRPLKLPRE
jgi:predicted Zn-dependent protease